jgi:hypothetical protein
LLWHNHYRDRIQEMAARRNGVISPRRNIERGQRAGADIVVLGHWHIPFTHEHERMLIVNPGAIASGNVTLKQTTQTVALLFIHGDGQVAVSHINLAQPERPFLPEVDWDAGFQANRYARSILAPELTAVQKELFNQVLPLAPRAITAVFHRLAHRCWAGEKELITAIHLVEVINHHPHIPSTVAARLEALLSRQEQD